MQPDTSHHLTGSQQLFELKVVGCHEYTNGYIKFGEVRK